MSVYTKLGLLVCGGLVSHSVALGQVPMRDRDSPQPIYWPRQDLIIPFQVDVAGEVPAEIQLELSEDQGRNWTLYTRGDVRTKQFNFHATKDGEYLFRLKTLDRNGVAFDNPGAPLLIVVDTNKPTGELLVDMDPRGGLQGEFRMVDASLDTSSIRMEYHTDSDPAWREIPVELERGVAAGEWIGFGTWSIPAHAMQLMVRVTGRDAAGNTIELTRMPRLPRSAANPTSMKLASNKGAEDASPPIGSGLARRFPTQSSQSLIVPTNNGPTEMLLNPPSNPIAGQTSPQLEIGNNPSERSTLRTPASSIQSAIREVAPNTREVTPINPSELKVSSPPTDLVSIADTPKSSFPTFESPRPGFPSNPESLPSGPSASLPTNSVSLANPPSGNTLISPTSKPHGIEPMHCSSRAFSLDYAIDNDPGAPIANIELWGTTDHGITWERWGTDPDRESPFDIEVASEGLFGFKMVIVGANGLASRRPLPTDKADAWILVDTAIPKAKILSALSGKGPEAGTIVIEYQAIDDHFPERPISIYYAESPKGPWIPATQGARNNGRFVWTADPSLPERVFLRIDAVDSAGNAGTHVLDLPVDVQGSAPRGRIQGFHPRPQ
ncbi:MAG: hypothetical protein FJ308_03660 [Planctomycetes bacterium]|nr:hypothetical protein [Planctomycetota bacterium]